MARLIIFVCLLFLAVVHFQQVYSASPSRNYPSGFRESQMEDPSGPTPYHGFSNKRPQSYRTYYPRRSKRSPNFSGGTDLSISAHRNFPGIGFFNVTLDGLRDLGFSFGNGNSGNGGQGSFSFQVQRIFQSFQGVGNSLANSFRDISNAASNSVQTTAKNFNHGVQNWSRSMGNLAQPSNNNAQRQVKNNQGQGPNFNWSFSWKTGRSLENGMDSFHQK